MKQFVLSKLGMVPREVKDLVAKTEDDCLVSSPLRFRKPWEMLLGNICQGCVSVAGDALHPMTPDLGQGACSSLEDGVVLARCIGEAFSNKIVEEELDGERVRKALEKYANERRWRSFNLIASAFVVGWFQQLDGRLMNFARDKWLAKVLAQEMLKQTYFDVGTLYNN